LREIARALRDSAGGFRGLRALVFALPARDELQISMNLEDVENAAPLDVFRRIEREVMSRGGSVTRTEVIGLVPDRLLQQAAEDRLKLEPGTTSRLLSARLFSHLTR
jgi:glutamate formiminotransferase